VGEGTSAAAAALAIAASSSADFPGLVKEIKPGRAVIDKPSRALCECEGCTGRVKLKDGSFR
jgi:hypothetical protein